jgi:hypothetical protein
LDDLLGVLCTDVDDKLEEEATLNMLENINTHTKGLFYTCSPRLKISFHSSPPQIFSP